jgi:two-component system NtrC family response regulator
MANVLIIDDDKAMCDWIANAVGRMGQKSTCAHTLGEGLRKARADSFAVVFLEAQMPDGSGLDIIPKIKANGYAPEIIIITGFGDPDEAELAITNGAWDYIEKPVSLEAIKLHLTRVLEYKAEQGTGKPPAALKRKDIIGSSQRLDSSFELLGQAAQSDVNVLITGETGTGKELFARAIHYNSPRAGRNFVIVDCTALPETLVENVLFGHARGSFTGAYTSQDGLIKQADRGTLFLDEIGELPLAMQKSFLRVTQEHRFRPVGGNQEVTSDFRLVAATNRNLEDMVRQGQFREDLLFRLRSLVIELPPLRECLEDIKELTFHYMKTLCHRFGIGPKGFSPEFWDAATGYKWPGNVRELIQALEKALLAAKEEPILYPKHLPTHIRIQVARNGVHKKSLNRDKPGISTTVPPTPPKLKELRRVVLSEAEPQYFKDLLSFVGGNIDEACRISGLSRSRLYTLLKKYRLSLLKKYRLSPSL